jgi:hypothetical protein
MLPAVVLAALRDRRVQTGSAEMRRLWDQIWMIDLLRGLGIAAFVVYAGWNAVWIARGQIPDSLWHFITGWPCPTTGGVRSLHALLAGQVGESLHLNPFTGVYIFLLAATAWVIGRQHAKGRKLALPRVLAWGWLGALVAGWVLKIALDAAHW